MPTAKHAAAPRAALMPMLTRPERVLRAGDVAGPMAAELALCTVAPNGDGPAAGIEGYAYCPEPCGLNGAIEAAGDATGIDARPVISAIETIGVIEVGGSDTYGVGAPEARSPGWPGIEGYALGSPPMATAGTIEGVGCARPSTVASVEDSSRPD